MSKKTTSSPEEMQSREDVLAYEVMAILDGSTTENQYKKNLAELKQLLESFGAEISHEEEWGKRGLAYPIKKQNYGYYVIFNFHMEPTKAQELKSQLRIMNFVLRDLVLKTPKGYVPQQYSLDEEEVKKTEPVKEERNEEKPMKKAVRETEEVAEVKEEKEDKDKEEAPKVEEKKHKEKMNQLKQKLEQLLSGGEDFNL